MNNDWQPGDLALCIKRGIGCPTCGIASLEQVGAVYTVREARDILFETGSRMWSSLALFFRELPDEHRDGACWTLGYNPARFRKICPHTPDAEDAETIRLLTGKPVKVTV